MEFDAGYSKEGLSYDFSQLKVPEWCCVLIVMLGKSGGEGRDRSGRQCGALR